MIQSNRLPLVVSLVLALGACGSPDASTSSDDLAPRENVEAASSSATIGAAGGVVEGKAGTLLEGVRLEIPAGALASDTEITITQTDDATPLALAAQRVGMQIRIEPAGLSLAAPAKITVPADPAWMAEFGAGPADMKVWARDGEGWKRIDAEAHDETHVTVSIGSFTTLAAGALLKPVSICGSACQQLRLCGAIGVESGLFCANVESIVRPMPELRADSIYMDPSGDLHYLAAVPGGVAAVHHVRPFETNAPRQSLPIANLATDRINPAVRGNDGHFFIGTGRTGNIEFAEDQGLRPIVWSDATDGLGAVMVQNGPFDLFTSNGAFQFDPLLRSIHRVGASPLMGTHASDPPRVRMAPGILHGFVTTSNVGGLGVYDLRTDTLDRANLVACPGPTLGTRLLAVDQAGDGTIAMSAYRTDNEGHAAVTTSVCKGNQIVDTLSFPGSFAFDGTNGLWAASTTAAEVLYRAPDGTKSFVSLSNDPVGSPAYLSRIPVAVRAGTGVVDQNRAWVITRGGDIVQLRKL